MDAPEVGDAIPAQLDSVRPWRLATKGFALNGIDPYEVEVTYHDAIGNRPSSEAAAG